MLSNDHPKCFPFGYPDSHLRSDHSPANDFGSGDSSTNDVSSGDSPTNDFGTGDSSADDVSSGNSSADKFSSRDIGSSSDPRRRQRPGAIFIAKRISVRVPHATSDGLRR